MSDAPERLNLNVGIRDFDLEPMGISLALLDETTHQRRSKAHVRVTLSELGKFVRAVTQAVSDTEPPAPATQAAEQDGQDAPVKKRSLARTLAIRVSRAKR